MLRLCFSFYVIICGSVSIVTDKSVDSGLSKTASTDTVTSSRINVHLRPEADSDLTVLGPGKTFGEVSLTPTTTAMRSATAVANTSADVLVVSRPLFHRSIERCQKADAKEKNQFVNSTSMFAGWSQQNRGLLVAALQHSTGKHLEMLFRQGTEASRVYFIRSGFVTLSVTHSKDGDNSESALRRRYQNDLEHQDGNTSDKKLQEICIIGPRDALGDVEVVYDLPHYMCTATCLTNVDAYCLDKSTFRFLFKQKNPETWLKVNILVNYKLISRGPNLKDFPIFVSLLTRANRAVELAEHKQKRRQQQQQQQQTKRRTRLREAAVNKHKALVTKRLGKIASAQTASEAKQISSNQNVRLDADDTDTMFSNVAQYETINDKAEEEPTKENKQTALTDDSPTGVANVESIGRRIPMQILLAEPEGRRWNTCFRAAVDMSNALHNMSRNETVKRLLGRLKQIKPVVVTKTTICNKRTRFRRASNPPPTALFSSRTTLPLVVGNRQLEDSKFIRQGCLTPIRGYVQERANQGTSLLKTRL